MSFSEPVDNSKEKRRFPRHAKRVGMKFLYRGAFHKGAVINLSTGGISFNSDVGLRVNSPVQFVFDLPYGIKCILNGKVLRIEEKESFVPAVGCSFAYSSAANLRVLDEFLNDQIDWNSDEGSRGKKRGRALTDRDPRLPTWWNDSFQKISDLVEADSSGNKLVEFLKALFKKKAS